MFWEWGCGRIELTGGRWWQNPFPRPSSSYALPSWGVKGQRATSCAFSHLRKHVETA